MPVLTRSVRLPVLPAWREVGEWRITPIITPSGLGVIGAEADSTDGDKPAANTETTDQPGGKSAKVIRQTTKLKRQGNQPSTKQASLIALLRRKQGATIAELSDASGWQAHSVQGAISGSLKKKLGLASEAVDGRVVRIRDA